MKRLISLFLIGALVFLSSCSTTGQQGAIAQMLAAYGQYRNAAYTLDIEQKERGIIVEGDVAQTGGKVLLGTKSFEILFSAAPLDNDDARFIERLDNVRLETVDGVTVVVADRTVIRIDAQKYLGPERTTNGEEEEPAE